jgi:hypothetical protein
MGCGGGFAASDGPVHDYMLSSPACFAAFNTLLAAEYSASELRQVHRLTVDTWAVQHPGAAGERRAVQSVGLHLARLMLQLESPRPPRETNKVMLDFSRHKHSLRPLAPPPGFRVTVADIVPFAGSRLHPDKVREWAEATWRDWSGHHDYIHQWIADHSAYRTS